MFQCSIRSNELITEIKYKRIFINWKFATNISFIVEAISLAVFTLFGEYELIKTSVLATLITAVSALEYIRGESTKRS